MKISIFDVKKDIKKYGKNFPVVMRIDRAMYDIMSKEWYFTLAYYLDHKSADTFKRVEILYEWIENNLDQVDENLWAYFKSTYLDKEFKELIILKEDYKFGSNFYYNSVRSSFKTVKDLIIEHNTTIVPSLLFNSSEEQMFSALTTESILDIIKEFIISYKELFGITEVSNVTTEEFDDFKKRIVDELRTKFNNEPIK
jgi:hypothetical protein